MCLIIVCKDKIPSTKTMNQANNTNSDGIGVAYRRKGKVVVRKGLNVKQAHKLLGKVKLPAIVHFRMATAGGDSKELIHPFVIDNNSNIKELSYETTLPVLFQNGHYSDYNEKLLSFCVNNNIVVPTGPWSDTRAIALMTSELGKGLLQLINNSKFAVFSDTDLETFGDGWIEENGMMFSNKYFKPTKKWQDESCKVLDTGFYGYYDYEGDVKKQWNSK